MTQRELVDDFQLYRQAKSMAALPASLKDRVLAAAASEQSATRPALVRQSLALVAVSLLCTGIVFVHAGGLRVTGRPLGLVLGTTVGTAMVALVVAVVALRNGGSSLPRPPRLLVPVLLAGPVVLLAWKIFWSSRYPGGLDAWLTRPGFRCLGLSVAMGLVPVIAFAVSRRASDPRRPALTGIAGGVAIGCLIALFTDLWCPVAYLPHLLLGHLLPIALLGGIGAWLGRRLIVLRHAR